MFLHDDAEYNINFLQRQGHITKCIFFFLVSVFRHLLFFDLYDISTFSHVSSQIQEALLLLIPQIFVECPLCVKYCSRHR